MTAYRKTVAVPVKTGSRDHRHSNQITLDGLRENSEGRLVYNDVPIVDATLLEQSLQNRDLLLLPYVVVSYSTYLSLASGLPRLELFTFDEFDPIDTVESRSVTFSKYDAVMDTSTTDAQLVTMTIPTPSAYQPDNRARQVWITTIPSYEDLLIEAEFDSEGEWYALNSDQKIGVLTGFEKIKVRLSLPRNPNVAEAERKLFGMYILYK